MNKLWWFTLGLLLVASQAAPSEYCSAYCSTCSGSTAADCILCPTGFNKVSGSCAIDTTAYTSVLETGSSTSTFSDQRAFNCGDFSGLPGMYPDDYVVEVASLTNVAPHYSMRARIFILWVDTWDATNLVQLIVDNTMRASATYSQANGTTDQCKRALTDPSSLLDTGDFAHNTAVAVAMVNISACLDTTKCNWGMKDFILIVKACHSYCSVCTTSLQTDCSACVSPYLLTGTTCNTTCGVGYYNSSATTCTICSTGCSACAVSASNCSACTASYYLLTGTSCVSTCPAGTYINGSLCSSCLTGCATCTNNPTPCQSCTTSYFLTASTCATSCPAGTFGNTATNTCDTCNSACTACTNTATNCTACSSGYALISSTYSCVTSCPASNYNSSGVCTTCSSSCATCTGNPSPCQSCNSGSFLSGTTCVASCPTGTFGNTATKTCDNCDTSCTTCTNTALNCSGCASGYALFSSNFTCLASCPFGYYNSSGTCATCNGSCATCTSNPSPCQSCNSGWFLTASTCATTCPLGTFANSATKTCDSCNGICTACSGTAVNCSACISSYLLFSSNYTCLNSCPAGFYNSSGTCATCNGSCATCTGSPSPCQSCNTGWFLSGITCITTCPALKFANSLNNKCDPCDTACLACNGTSSNCSSCITAFALVPYNFTCVLNCPTGWWEKTSINSCIQCDPGCAVCTGTPTPCQACNTGYFTYLTGCVNPCPNGFYGDNFLGSCQPCATNCTICTNLASNCSACITNYYLIVDQAACKSSCPTTLYYPVTASNTCIHCDVGCQVCAGPASNCSACLATYYYYASSTLCTLTCPALTTTTSTWICLDCDPVCLVCVNTATNCTSCVSTSVLFQSNFTCIPSCPAGYFENSSNICQTCQTGCATCTGIPTPCQTCTAGYFLFSGACGNTCPAGTWGNTVTRNCDTCHSNCTTCTSAVVCQTCSPGFYWFRVNSTCLNPCPTYYYKNNTDMQCYGYFCSPYCLSNGCSGIDYNMCLNCSSYYIYNSTSNTCYPDPSRYVILFEGKNDTSLANVTGVGSCGTKYVNMPGLYGPSVSILIYQENLIVQNHCRIRVRMGVIFIDDWTSGNYITITIDGTNYGTGWFQNSQVAQQQCNGPTWQRSIVMDTGDINHFNHNATVILKSSGCANSATCLWMYREPLIMIIPCHPYCLTCTGTANSNCQSCANTTSGIYLLSNSTCAPTCHPESFQTGPNMCTFCDWSCTRCNYTITNCTQCRSGFVLVPDQFTCPLQCPPKYYNSSNVCIACPTLCSVCASTTVCSACVTGNYMYNNYCYATCPTPLYDDNYTMTCLTFQQYYVFLTVSSYFVQGDLFNIDMAFSQPLDFNTFPYQTWQTFNTSSFPTLTMSCYKLTYSILNDSAYRIQLTTNDFTFLTNETLSMLTNDNLIQYTSIYGRPFYITNYNTFVSTIWTYVKITNMSAAEESYSSVLVSMSDSLNDATGVKYVQEAKKVGIALLIANSLQITSCMLLVNTVPPKNFYNGVRLLASTVFFDVPPYQMESTKQKYLVVPTINDLTSRRLLSATPLDQTNFRRTGFTGYFLFDAYPQVIVIVLLWLLILPCYFYRQTKWGGKFYGYFNSAQHKFTDLAIMYFTLALLFEFVYFQDQVVRYVSLVLCILCNLYLFFFELYRYYDLAAYPYAEINTPEYERYVLLYGGFLKYLRYVQYKPRKEGAWKFNWREPCSYHIVSYIKKLLMMFALAIFYERAEVQMAAIILIQIGEIIRFCLVWPFRSRFYNWFRLTLEIVLLTLFVCVLAYALLLQNIMSVPSEESGPFVISYYIVGWVALVLVLIFNSGFVLIFLYDFIHGLRYTNKEIIDMTRKEHYAALLNKYEKGNEEVPERLLKNWAKKGMVDEEKEKRTASGAKILVESYTIRLDQAFYIVDINKIIEFEKRREFLLVNNAQFLRPTRTIEHERFVEPDDELFPYFDKIYRAYATEETVELQVKSFIYVDQGIYKIGQKVELEFGNATEHVVTIKTDNLMDRNIEVASIEGFPIPIDIFKRLYLM